MNPNELTGAPLSADLVSAVAEPTLEMLVLRLALLEPGVGVDGGDLAVTGPARVQVAEVIRGRTWRAGQSLAMPVLQLQDPALRARRNLNHWNGLALEPGRHLLAACLPERDGTVCRARAAIAIASPGSAAVLALKKSCDIEQHLDQPAQVLPQVVAALSGPQDLHFFYALDLAGRRQALGRDQGAQLLAKGLVSPSLAPAARLEIASQVLNHTALFAPDRRADAANVALVSGFASAMVAQADPAARLDWMRFLASLLLRELAPGADAAAALRRELIRRLPTPSRQQVLDTLALVQQQAGEADRARATELAEAWRSAFK